VRVDDLIDARDVAELLGLAHRNTVSKYQSRYPDMPRPVVNLGPGRPMLWLRPEIERWDAKTAAAGRTRLGRRPSDSGSVRLGSNTAGPASSKRRSELGGMDGGLARK
jgi:predicted DNA-binding transcriptional regulator AlpA